MPTFWAPWPENKIARDDIVVMEFETTVGPDRTDMKLKRLVKDIQKETRYMTNPQRRLYMRHKPFSKI
jgi:hypothetical protein